MQMELPIDLLRTFRAVFEAGTFTQAGEKRHVTQAAVSMQMKRLESLIGRPLFAKNGRQLRLTAAGETLLEHAHNILAAHDNAVAAFSNPELFGRVRFGCAEEYATRFLPAVLPSFRKAFPRIQVDIQVAPGIELFEWLSKEELDLCLLESIPTVGSAGRRKPKAGRGKTPCAHCSVKGGQVVHREPVVWVTSRNAAAHEMDPLPLAVYHKGCAYRQWAEESLRSIGRQYWIAFVSPSISSILSAVKTGLAVAPIGFGSMTEGLRQLLPEQGFPLLPISEVSLHRSASADNEVVHCFANYVAESFRLAREENQTRS
jgi:DNA-binding transcriptional LysR family regulator